MNTFEWQWKNPAQVDIYAKGWTLENNKAPKAVVLLQHGLGEHIGRYEHVAQWLNEHDIVMLGCDRSGHGKSGGKRGHIHKYEYTFDDIKQLKAKAKELYPNVPLFLYGHSMGGGIVANYLVTQKDTDFAGVIATAPAFRPGFKPSSFDLFMGKIMRKIYPAFSQNNGLDLNYLSKDKAVIEAYKNDKLVHGKLTAETGLGLIDFGQEALDKVDTLAVPMLLLHGTDDKLTDPSASAEFVQKAKGDLTYKSYEGWRHELHNEIGKEGILHLFIDWIFSKIKDN